MTYTDIENRVNDQIQVGYNSRITTQKIRALNNENEYWGKMTGTFVGTIVPQELRDSTMVNTGLSDSFIMCEEGNVDLTDMVYGIDEMQTDISGIEGEVADISAQVSAFAGYSLSTYETIVSAEIEHARLSGEISAIRNGLCSTWLYLEHNLSGSPEICVYTLLDVVNMLSAVKTGLERIFGTEIPDPEPEPEPEPELSTCNCF